MNIDYFLNLPMKTQLAMGSSLAVIASLLICGKSRLFPVA